MPQLVRAADFTETRPPAKSAVKSFSTGINSIRQLRSAIAMKSKQDYSICLDMTHFSSLLLSNLIYTFMNLQEDIILKSEVDESFPDMQILY